jgi:hypothetical protein
VLTRNRIILTLFLRRLKTAIDEKTAEAVSSFFITIVWKNVSLDTRINTNDDTDTVKVSEVAYDERRCSYYVAKVTIMVNAGIVKLHT